MCSSLNIAQNKHISFPGLENSTAVCVVAGSDHSAALTGRYQLFRAECTLHSCMLWSLSEAETAREGIKFGVTVLIPFLT